MKKGFKRHFRIYLVNNHPAYIVDEAGNKYYFHRITSSKKSGGRNNFKITPNPLYSGKDEMYIVKRIEKDKVNRFSKFKLEVRKGFSVEYPFIDKKTPSASANKSDVTSSGSKIIKPKKKWFVNRFSSSYPFIDKN